MPRAGAVAPRMAFRLRATPSPPRGAHLRSRNASKRSFAFGRRPAYCGQYVLGNALTAQHRACGHDDARFSCLGPLPSGSTGTPMHLGRAGGTSCAPGVGQDSRTVLADHCAYAQASDINGALLRAPCWDAGAAPPTITLLGPPSGVGGLRKLRAGVARATFSLCCSTGNAEIAISHCSVSPPSPRGRPHRIGSCPARQSLPGNRRGDCCHDRRRPRRLKSLALPIEDAAARTPRWPSMP